MEHTDRELEVARVIEEFRRGRVTAKLELDFKDGMLTCGRKIVPLFK